MLHCFPTSKPATKRRRWIATFYFAWSATWFTIFACGWNGSGLFGRSPFPFGMGLIFACLGVGIELGREGARLSSGITACLLAAIGICVGSVFATTTSWTAGIVMTLAIWAILWEIPWLVVSAYSFLPSTRAHFADVRNAKAGSVAQR